LRLILALCRLALYQNQNFFQFLYGRWLNGTAGATMAKQTSAEFRALVADAMTHFHGGRLSDAENAYRAALAIVPADPAVTHNLGVAIAAQGRHREAIGCFEQALRADPSFVSAHYNRAVALTTL